MAKGWLRPCCIHLRKVQNLARQHLDVRIPVNHAPLFVRLGDDDFLAFAKNPDGFLHAVFQQSLTFNNIAYQF